MSREREVHDHYFKQAKRAGYRSRAAYKLIEIDDRKKVLSRGDSVLDCGAAPGSWLQVAAERIGPQGIVIGVDIQPIEPNFSADNIIVHEGDVTTIDVATMLELCGRECFDVVLSDMAPQTTGDAGGDHHRSVRLCESLAQRLPQLLREGGNCVMKVFEGEAYPALLKNMATMFEQCRGFVPGASRSESREIFIVGHGYRKPDDLAGLSSKADNRKRPKPAPGWKSRD